MIFLFCMCLFITIAFAITLFYNKRIEEILAPTAMFMILVLYISGLFKNLLIGEYIIIGCAIVSFIMILFYIKKNRLKDIKQYITPGFFALVIFLIFNFVICKGRWLSEGDEFSHWGRATLNMYKWNKYGNCVQPMTLFFPGYPPAVSLWEYFFVCLKSTFSEPYLFAAHNVLCFILMLPIYKKIEWKHWKKALFLLAVLFLIPFIFYRDFWTTVYVDGLLGVWMFYILYVHFSEKENTPFKILKICLALGIYPLVKASGSGLAFLLILIIIVDSFICNSSEDDWKKKIGMLFGYIISVVIGKQSWALFLKLINSKAAWNNSSVNISNIVGFLKGDAEGYQYNTVRNFISRFFQVAGWSDGKFATIDWILIIIFLSFFMYILKIWSRKQLFLYIGSFMISIGIYAASLLILYCFTFGAYEGPNLASYERYMGSILLGIISFIIFTLASESHNFSEKIMITVLLCYMVPFGVIVNLNESKQKAIELRLPYENTKEFPDFMDWTKDKVYVIDQGSSGSAHIISSYNAIPVVCSPEWGWSLGPALFEGDVWTVDYSVDEWENVLLEGEYTYVYIFHKDEQFVEIYSDLFENPKEIEDRALYKMYEENGNTVLKMFKQY